MNMLKRGDERIFRLSTFALVAFIALVCMPTVAFGDEVTMKLGQPTTPYPNGVYVDPYPISVNGATTPSLLSSDDYATEIYVGYQWKANRYLLGALDTVAGTTPKFNAPDPTNPWVHDGTVAYTVQELYRAAALLTVDLLLHPANRPIDSYAIWSIFDPHAPPEGGVTGDVALAATTLAAVHAGLPAKELAYLNNNVYIYTPLSATPSQEFIGVPDGGMTLMLLGGALVG